MLRTALVAFLALMPPACLRFDPPQPADEHDGSAEPGDGDGLAGGDAAPADPAATDENIPPDACRTDADCGLGSSCDATHCAPLAGVRLVPVGERAVGDELGYRVAASGSTFAGGAHQASAGAGRVVVLTAASGGVEDMPAIGAGDLVGFSVALDGDVLVAGAFGDDGVATNAGAAYVYRRGPAGWALEDILTASGGANADRFGAAVAVAAGVIAVYARGAHDDSGAVYVFRWDGSMWEQKQVLAAPLPVVSDLGFGSALALDARRLVVGQPQSDAGGTRGGEVHVYVDTGASFQLEGSLRAADATADDELGRSVAISGDLVVAGARYGGPGDRGAAVVFQRREGAWSEVGTLIAGDGEAMDGFGNAVSINGTRIAVGALGHAHGVPGAGAVYLFAREAPFLQLAERHASTRTLGAGFGHSVALGAEVGIAGSYPEAVSPAAGDLYLFGL